MGPNPTTTVFETQRERVETSKTNPRRPKKQTKVEAKLSKQSQSAAASRQAEEEREASNQCPPWLPSSSDSGMSWVVVISISILKLLAIPAYHSTDFEVHRNWLAITFSSPISNWYLDETSQWTLDYPPFFAWFEYLMAFVAQYFDAGMLVISNLEHSTINTVLFMRLSVVVTDLVFFAAINSLVEAMKSRSNIKAPRSAIGYFLVFNFGLWLVDHVHFQYNGFLYGVMLLSLSHAVQGRYISCAFLFAALLNLKHIYLYIAPAFFVFLFRVCFPSTALSFRGFNWVRFSLLGFVVIVVFGLSLGPFIQHNQLLQLVSRLFPFQRGLCHAYWAPNFWALYNGLDQVLRIVGPRFQLFSVRDLPSATRGLVTDEDMFGVLPSVPPLATFVMTLLAMMPSLVKLFLVAPAKPSFSTEFIRTITLCGFASFYFGWHVHEKAILLALIPLTLLAFSSVRAVRAHIILTAASGLSLLPLVFTPAEQPVVVFAFLASIAFTFGIHQQVFSFPFNFMTKAYIVGVVPVLLGYYLLPVLLPALPFLPLMLISLYSTLGVTMAFILTYMDVGTDNIAL
eukprot:m.20033 g.20033  ORF g.20033 m.20033 type:complete len:569 (-) comp8107_c0_seq2:108-1814(-)